MREAFEAYVARMLECGELMRPNFSSTMSPQHILDTVHANAQRMAEIKAENDAVLKAYVYGQDPGSLTPEDVRELQAFASALYSSDRRLDIGAAYRVHQLLYAYAEHTGDRDAMIRELYYQGLTLNSLHLRVSQHNINTCGSEIHDYFTRCAAYIREYDDIASEETRGFIIRGLGNRKYGDPALQGNNTIQPFHELDGYRLYMKYFYEAMAVIGSPEYRAKNPGLPWKSFEYSMRFDHLKYLSVLRDASPEEALPIAREMLESAEFVYRHQEEIARHRQLTVGARTRYVYAATRFHAGRADAMEVVRTVLDCVEKADPEDYSVNGMMLNVGLLPYAQAYLCHLSERERALVEPEIEYCQEQGKAYLLRLPSEHHDDKLSFMVAEVVRGQLISMTREMRFQLLEYLLLCHPPTYVHSYMVALLARRLFERMARVSPQHLVGAFGVGSAQEIVSRLDELLDRAYYCGLYHDIGKTQIMSNITTYGRSLLKEEFEAIQFHPMLGYHTLKACPDMQDEAEVNLRHHRFYNEHGGYREAYGAMPDSVRMMVHIVTVADSIDAATDNVGRSYAAGKTLQKLLEELRAQSGTRYCPEVVALFDDADFCEKLEREMKRQREELYCRAYRAFDMPPSKVV